MLRHFRKSWNESIGSKYKSQKTVLVLVWTHCTIFTQFQSALPTGAFQKTSTPHMGSTTNLSWLPHPCSSAYFIIMSHPCSSANLNTMVISDSQQTSTPCISELSEVDHLSYGPQKTLLKQTSTPCHFLDLLQNMWFSTNFNRQSHQHEPARMNEWMSE